MVDNQILLVIGGIALLYLINRTDEKQKDKLLQKRAEDVHNHGDVQKAIDDNPTEQTKKEAGLFLKEISGLSGEVHALGSKLMQNSSAFIMNGTPDEDQRNYYRLKDQYARVKRLFVHKQYYKFPEIDEVMKRLSVQSKNMNVETNKIKAGQDQKSADIYENPPPNTPFPIVDKSDLTQEDHEIRNKFSADGGTTRATTDAEEVASTLDEFGAAALQNRALAAIQKGIESRVEKHLDANLDLASTACPQKSAFKVDGDVEMSDGEKNAAYRNKSGLTTHPAPNTAPVRTPVQPAPQSFNSAPVPPTNLDLAPACPGRRDGSKTTTIRV